MSRDACALILYKQGKANILQPLLGLLPRGIGFRFLMLSLGSDFLGNGESFLPADFLCYSCSLVTYKGGIINFSV